MAPKIPKAKIEDITKDPESFAIDFIEMEFTRAIPKFLKGFKIGQKFGKELMDNIDE